MTTLRLFSVSLLLVAACGVGEAKHDIGQPCSVEAECVLGLACVQGRCSPPLSVLAQQPGVCGDGVLNAGELCDPAIKEGAGHCPNADECNDGDACTTDLANADTCMAACSATRMKQSPSGDGCCLDPENTPASHDSDCPKLVFMDRCQMPVDCASAMCELAPSDKRCTQACNEAAAKVEGDCPSSKFDSFTVVCIEQRCEADSYTSAKWVQLKEGAPRQVAAYLHEYHYYFINGSSTAQDFEISVTLAVHTYDKSVKICDYRDETCSQVDGLDNGSATVRQRLAPGRRMIVNVSTNDAYAIAVTKM